MLCASIFHYGEYTRPRGQGAPRRGGNRRAAVEPEAVEVPAAAQLAERLRAQPRTARSPRRSPPCAGAHLVGRGGARPAARTRARRTSTSSSRATRPRRRARRPRRAGRRGARARPLRDRHRRAPDGLVFDVVTARGGDLPAARARCPRSGPARWTRTWRRRDFTVNAIALALHAPALGRLRAHPGALDDLEARDAARHARRAPSSTTRPACCASCATRARLEFEPDTRTDALARDAIAAGALGTVSGRARGRRAAPAARPRPRLCRADPRASLGLDRALHPSFDPRLDLAERALRRRRRRRRRDLLVARRRAARASSAAELERPGCDRLEIPALPSARRWSRPRWTRRRWPSASSTRTGPPRSGTSCSGARPRSSRWPPRSAPATPCERWQREVRDASLEITGDDLLAAGVPEGPHVGRGAGRGVGGARSTTGVRTATPSSPPRWGPAQ